ncbi:MAG: DUF1667 domain-containing protein [Candidatus Omnitrophica bacterium]|nr:DUF1667 domain-containing protein [Candidatus Omnitrophota bacterium]
MKRDLICTICPLGCKVMATYAHKKATAICGNRCPKGEAYALSEIRNPRRILTTTIKVEGGIFPLVSVRTNRPISRDSMRRVVKNLHNTFVKAPIEIGDRLAHGVSGSGSDIVATRSIPKKKAKP